MRSPSFLASLVNLIPTISHRDQPPLSIYTCPNIISHTFSTPISTIYPLEVKIRLIGLIFPEKLSFDGKTYRTKNMNRVLDLIYQQTRELRGRRKEKWTNDCSLVHSSDPNRTLLEPILGDLEKLYEMRFWIPNPGEPISPQFFHSTNQWPVNNSNDLHKLDEPIRGIVGFYVLGKLLYVLIYCRWSYRFIKRNSFFPRTLFRHYSFQAPSSLTQRLIYRTGTIHHILQSYPLTTNPLLSSKALFLYYSYHHYPITTNLP